MQRNDLSDIRLARCVNRTTGNVGSSITMLLRWRSGKKPKLLHGKPNIAIRFPFPRLRQVQHPRIVMIQCAVISAAAVQIRKTIRQNFSAACEPTCILIIWAIFISSRLLFPPKMNTRALYVFCNLHPSSILRSGTSAS